MEDLPLLRERRRGNCSRKLKCAMVALSIAVVIAVIYLITTKLSIHPSPSPNDDTEISRLLRSAYEKLYPDKDTVNTLSLEMLVSVMFSSRIFTVSDLPESIPGKLALFKKLVNNPLASILLPQALGLNVPTLPSVVHFPGSGYSPKSDANCGVDICSGKPVITKGKMKISDTGYAIPEGIILYDGSQKLTLFDVYINYEEYFHQRYTSSEFSVGLTLEKFDGGFGFNDAQAYIDSGGQGIEKLSFVEEIGMLNMELDQNAEEFRLDPKFVEVVKKLPIYNIQDCTETYESWQSFFDDYGSHVTSKYILGGSVSVTIEGRSLWEKFYTGANYSLNANAALSKVFGFDYGTGEIINNSGFISSTSLVKSAILLGGDAKYHSFSIIDMDTAKRQELVQQWQDSLPNNPSILRNRIMIKPLAKYVEKALGSRKQVDILNYSEALHRWWTDSLDFCKKTVPTIRKVVIQIVPLGNGLPLNNAIKKTDTSGRRDMLEVTMIYALYEGDYIFCNDNEICELQNNSPYTGHTPLGLPGDCGKYRVEFRYADSVEYTAKPRETFAATGCGMYQGQCVCY